jgi:AcrR family transcriptional regulator
MATISMQDTTDEPARRSQAERRGESERRMMRAAAKLIARHGVAGTSLAEVGIAAGYSRGLPVDRYGSKLGLVRALLAATESWFHDHLARELAGKSGLEAIELRTAAHLASVDRSDSATAALHAIYTASQSVMPEIKKPVAAFTKRWCAGLVMHMREGQRSGEIRKDIDCEAEARFLLAAMRGLMMQYLMDGSRRDLAQAKAILIAHCRDRLGAAGTRRTK